MTRRRKILLLLFALVVVVALVVLCVALVMGSRLTAPVQSTVGPPPTDFDAEEVSFESTSGSTLKGWFSSGQPGGGAVVLMHPLRGNRHAMLGRARFLHDRGYSVLLFDFQAHGESPGENITFGYLESRDAQAAVRFVRERLPNEKVGVIGRSLGGAACLLGDGPVQVDAMILEAVYPDIDSAVHDRLRIRLGKPGALAAPLLLWQLRPRLGIGRDQLRPIDHIGRVPCPLLLLAGTDDMHTTLDESRMLYSAAPEPKAMWEVKGAAHVDFHQFDTSNYEARVSRFLEQHLRN